MKKLVSLLLVAASIGMAESGWCQQHTQGAASKRTQQATSVQRARPSSPAAFTSEQAYAGEIQFDKSKNVVLHLTLSPDLKKVAKLVVTIGSLYLTPQNFDTERKDSDQAVAFNFLENTNARTSLVDHATSPDQVASKEITGGGFEATSPIDITNGKIVLGNRPLISDLTVAAGYIYGTVKVEIQGCGTKQVYVVLKNTTTPKSIPQNILTPR